jgi:hypothetical protein
VWQEDAEAQSNRKDEREFLVTIHIVSQVSVCKALRREIFRRPRDLEDLILRNRGRINHRAVEITTGLPAGAGAGTFRVYAIKRSINSHGVEPVRGVSIMRRKFFKTTRKINHLHGFRT